MRVLRAYNGRLMTSIDMAGIQASIFKLGEDGIRRRLWLDYLDSPTDAPAWPKILRSRKTDHRYTHGPLPAPLIRRAATDVVLQAANEKVFIFVLDDNGERLFEEVLKSMDAALRLKQKTLDDLDAGVGDGDTGRTLLRGIEGI